MITLLKIIKNPLRIWMLIPFAIIFTVYTFYYQIILNQIPPIFRFSPSVNNVVKAWGTQSGFDIAGQVLVFQFICLGALVLWIESQN